MAGNWPGEAFSVLGVTRNIDPKKCIHRAEKSEAGETYYTHAQCRCISDFEIGKDCPADSFAKKVDGYSFNKYSFPINACFFDAMNCETFGRVASGRQQLIMPYPTVLSNVDSLGSSSLDNPADPFAIFKSHKSTFLNYTYPTKLFTISEPSNPRIDELNVAQKRWPAKFQALKLSKDRSGTLFTHLLILRF